MKKTLLISCLQLAIFITLSAIVHKAWPQNSRTDTLLLDAIKKSDFKLVSAYVNAGADVNFLDENKATILQWATLKTDLKTVRLLADKGSNFNGKGRIYIDSTRKGYYGNLLSIAAAEKIGRAHV